MTDEQNYRAVKQVYHRVGRILVKMYPVAKANIAFYETHELKKATAAITDLRDVLDHLAIATKLAYDNPRKGSLDPLIADNLVSAEEHLRRAAVEPLQLAVEDKMAGLISRLEYSLFDRLLLLEPVNAERVTAALTDASKKLAEARSTKGNSESLTDASALLREAYDSLLAVERNLPRVSAIERRRRAVVLGVALFAVGSIAGVLAGLLLSK